MTPRRMKRSLPRWTSVLSDCNDRMEITLTETVVIVTRIDIPNCTAALFDSGSLRNFSFL